MPTITVHVVDRSWANKARSLEVLTFRDPANPNVTYQTGPCPNTIVGEAQAIQDFIDRRKAAGLDYPGQPGPSPETATVTV